MSNVRDQVMTRQQPLPQPTLDNHEFYEAAQRGELRFQRCADCGTWRHYPRPVCPECLSTRLSWERASGRGTIYTWTIVHGPTLPAFQDDLPYNVCIVELDEGPRIYTTVIGLDNDDIKAGMDVNVVWDDVTDEITLPKFTPIG